MHRMTSPPRCARWGVLLGLMLSVLLIPDARAQQPVGPAAANANAKFLVVAINGTRRLQTSSGKALARVINSKENVARVQGIAGEIDKVLIVGLEPGTTHVSLI